MRLTLDREDLKKEFQDVACSATTFDMFTAEARDAIRSVGRATFREYDDSNYKAIYPPKFVSYVDTKEPTK
jgi:hypothetical protein